MSYRSRLYNHRNAQSPETNIEKPFFSKQAGGNEMKSQGSFFQAKLAVNKPGDQYEKEADSVAQAVVNNNTASPVLHQKNISPIQRLATTKEEEIGSTNDQRMDRDKEKPFQRMTAEPEKEKLKGIQKMEQPEKEKMKSVQKMDNPEKEKMKSIQKMDNPEKEKIKGVQKMGDPKKEEDKKKPAAVQKKQDGTATTASSTISAKIQDSTSKGQALPKKTMHEMSDSFGVDFSHVRVHNNSEATEMNKELNAHAFTYGNDIFFNEGKFDPNSSNGKFLLAHELTHVVQQNGVPEKGIQKDDGDNSKDPSQKDTLAVQPGGPFDVNDQVFSLKGKNDGTWEGCGPLPGAAAGSDNACISGDSIDQIKNYFKKKPVGVDIDRPANCPPERWNFPLGQCCPPGKHIDPDNKFNCIKNDNENHPFTLPAPEPGEKGDFELPDSDTQYA